MNSTTFGHPGRTRQHPGDHAPPFGRTPGASDFARRIGATLHLWRQRIEGRRRLHALDQALLKDMGISRSDALQEAAKPFWRP